MIFVPSFLVPRCLYSYVEVRLTRRMSEGLVGMRVGRRERGGDGDLGRKYNPCAIYAV